MKLLKGCLLLAHLALHPIAQEIAPSSPEGVVIENNASAQETASFVGIPERDTTPIEMVKEALCYAERYPDLMQGFCHGDASRCVYNDLWGHYKDHGKSGNLLWGCRDRVTEHAIPSSNLNLEQRRRLRSTDDAEVHFLIFETSEGDDEEMRLIEQSVSAGIRTTRIGRGAKFEGFSTKWQIILKFLKDLNASPDTLLVITDARDVLLNVHDDYINQEDITNHMTSTFFHAYNTLTAAAPGAIVMSAEAQCCVAALTFAQPGSYFDEHGKRSQRACASGAHDCRWGGDSKVVVWEDFQIDLAYNRTGRNVHDVFLNAGLAAGRPADWIRLLETVELEAYEDDQAVFTEYMYHRPDQIVLDYASEMFGTARWPIGMNEKGCPFGEGILNKKKQPGRFPALRHLESRTMPLLLHTPGKFFACYDYMAQELGLSENNDSTGHGGVALKQRRRLKGGKEDKKQQQPKEDKKQQQNLDNVQHAVKEDKKQKQAQQNGTTEQPPKQPKKKTQTDTTAQPPNDKKKKEEEKNQNGTTVDKKKKDEKKKKKKNMKNKQKTKIPENYVVRVRGLRTLD